MDRLGIDFGEASTWRGLVTLLTLLGWNLAPEHQELVVSAGVSLVGLLGVVFRRPDGG